MIQDIFPHVYHNEMKWKQPDGEDFVLCYGPGRILYCKVADNTILLPRVADLPALREDLQYLFSIDQHDYYLAECDTSPAPGWDALPTGELRNFPRRARIFAAAAGESLYRWYSSQRYCGRCGTRMEKSRTERAMVCPACRNTVYPKICPAVIVAVHDGERLLLTRYLNRPITSYALVAGFNEIGESIEETVHREVLEETGVHVKNLKFYKSQPWVFTDTLLFGFFAELDGDDHITVQTDELSMAAWVDRADLPADDKGLSLTAEMIEQFRTGAVK